MPRLKPRLVAAAAVATALTAASAAQAGSPSRDVAAEYTAPSGTQQGATLSIGGQGSTVGSARLPTRRGERLVTLQISDDSGRPVTAEVVQVVDEQTGAFVQLGEVCGPAPQTFRLERREAPVVVRPLVGVCAAGPSTPTTGTVQAMFR